MAKDYKSILLQFLLIFMFFIVTTLTRSDPKKEDQLQAYLLPPPFVESLHFGYRYVIADMLWIRSLQDFMYCESKIAENRCKGEGWLYSMLSMAGHLSPDFIDIYRVGALILSVVTSDIEGSSKLFDEGVDLYPNDFQMVYRAAYHALYEEKNNRKAADLYLRSAKLGGPQWVYALAIKLYNNEGAKDMSLKIYNDLKEQKLEKRVLKSMRSRLGLPDEDDESEKE